MALKLMIAALAVAAAASPLSATMPEPTETGTAPAASETAKYCLNIEITGSRVEKVLCLTRQEWADQEVDVDREWAENGVRVVG